MRDLLGHTSGFVEFAVDAKFYQLEASRLDVPITPEEILEFAKHYGVLGLCEHRLPYSHAPAAIHNRSSLEPEPKGCLPLQVEKLANWRWYAQGF